MMKPYLRNCKYYLLSTYVILKKYIVTNDNERKYFYHRSLIFVFRTKKHKDVKNKRKRKCNDNTFSRKGIETLLCDITDEQLLQHFTISQIIPQTFVRVDDVLCSHSSIFIGGNHAT